MNGALSQVWGMINGLQVPIHFPILDVKFPETTQGVVEILLGVATFDIPYVNFKSMFGGWLIGLPEDHDFTHDKADLVENLDSLDLSSRLASVNLGSVFIAILTAPAIYSITTLLGCTKRIGPRVESLHSWFKAKFMWNWLIRLTLESSLELTITAAMALSVRLEDREPLWIEKADIVFSSFALLWVAGYHAFVLFFYPANSSLMKYEIFKDIYGSTYDGLKPKLSSLAYPIMFMARRALFVGVALFTPDFVWL